MKTGLKYSLLVVMFVTAFIGCKKEADSPPISTLVERDIITIDSLKSWQDDTASAIVIDSTLSVYGIVTMDESNGNIYKNIYLQDHTGAINVRFNSSTDLVQGDSIRLSFRGGVTLNRFNGVYQIDGVEEETNVVVQSSGNTQTPIVSLIDEIQEAYELSLADGSRFEYQSKLIQFNNVQFKNSELLNTYADEVNQSSENRYFEDFDGNTTFIRTSGFSDFAGDSLPKGSGSLVCIVSEYNGELQYILRSPEEANLTNQRGSGEFLVKDFDDDDLYSGGWTVQQVIGAETWEVGDLGSWEDRPYGVISNYDGSNSACESWFISPALDLSASTSAAFSFDNADNYGGDPLRVLVSVDYPGTGDPNLYTWTELAANWSAGEFEFVNSGQIDLVDYLMENVHIAFKYVGTDSNGRTCEIDNITING